MRCPYCATEIPNESAFCEHCGGALMDRGRASTAGMKEVQSQATTHGSPAGRIPAGAHSVTTEKPWGKLTLGAVVGAATAAVPGVLLLLVAVFAEMTTTAQGSSTGVGLLGLCGGAMVVIGAAAGAVFGGVLGAVGAAIGHRVRGRRGATAGAIVGGVIGGAIAAVGPYLVGSPGAG